MSLYLMAVVMHFLEFAVAVEIGQIMVPLGGALDLHLTKRIRTFHFDDAHTRYAVMVGEYETIRRTSKEVVSEHSQPRPFPDIIGHGLKLIDHHLLMTYATLDGHDMVQILWGIDIIAETLDVR